jgi:hypothetical protein
MHITDINHDIARRDLRGIEDAFRALVGWPNETAIRGATASNRKAALEAASKALLHDASIMPRETAAIIADAVRGQSSFGSTYAEGAAVVLANLEAWAERLETV